MGLCSVIRGAAAKLTRENNRLKMQLTEERERRVELEDADLELGNLVELAGMIEEV